RQVDDTKTAPPQFGQDFIAFAQLRVAHVSASIASTSVGLGWMKLTDGTPKKMQWFGAIRTVSFPLAHCTR
ncbi:MAG: hypothetical protein KDD83_02010, partial [Caldilineaceae bacterium]|nr:hypothetical protein [Caldilineaceae bacterium]